MKIIKYKNLEGINFIPNNDGTFKITIDKCTYTDENINKSYPMSLNVHKSNISAIVEYPTETPIKEVTLTLKATMLVDPVNNEFFYMKEL
jgi:hypothetical protein